MLDRFVQIAPLSTWGLVLGATLLLVCGFVTFSHAKVVRQAYGESFHGLLSPGVFESTIRWTGFLLPAGFLLWGIALHWPLLTLLSLGAVSILCLGAEAAARARAARRPDSASAGRQPTARSSAE